MLGKRLTSRMNANQIIAQTMDASFMELCWWVFKQLFDKGLVYRAYQIMPYSTALCTPLSQVKAKQNEKMT